MKTKKKTKKPAGKKATKMSSAKMRSAKSAKGTKAKGPKAAANASRQKPKAKKSNGKGLSVAKAFEQQQAHLEATQNPMAVAPTKQIPPHELRGRQQARNRMPKNVRNQRTNGAGARHH